MMTERRREMTQWDVCKNPMLGEKPYRVFRKLREDEPLHSGNVEYTEDMYSTRDEALKAAASMNNL